ncbi:MAG: hypothetical protein QW099_00935 [Candidatus Bathyarchaeia archaeon]
MHDYMEISTERRPGAPINLLCKYSVDPIGLKVRRMTAIGRVH